MKSSLSSRKFRPFRNSVKSSPPFKNPINLINPIQKNSISSATLVIGIVFLAALLGSLSGTLAAETTNGLAVAEANPSDVHWLRQTCAAGAVLDAAGVPYRVLVLSGDGRHYEASCLYRAGALTFSYGEGGSRIYYPGLDKDPLPSTWHLPQADVLKFAEGRDSIPLGCLVYATAAYRHRKLDPQVIWAGLINVEVIRRPDISDSGFGMNLIVMGAPEGHAICAFETRQHEVFVEEDGHSPKQLDSYSRLAQDAKTSWRNADMLAHAAVRKDDLQSHFVDQFSR